jgi:hypothetical protein
MVGVDEIALDVNTILFCIWLVVENAHQQCHNDILLFDEAHFQAMELQALSQKPHNTTSIC